MTTESAADRYIKIVVFNPNSSTLESLPVIYGFKNSGTGDLLTAVFLSEDGEVLGSHWCSDEAYMPHDLGILEGSRQDRHATFREHYPEGYRMEFVGSEHIKDHAGLQQAIRKYKEKTNVGGTNAT